MRTERGAHQRKKKSAAPELSEGPTLHRRQHTPFTRDVLTPPGAPIIARHRTRTILTPLELRRAILEDIASKPETVRLRSLRRRLTALDRMLSDREAEALERVTSCLNALSNIGAVNYLKSEVQCTPLSRLPFSEKRRREISAMTYVLKALDTPNRSAVLHLAALLDPSHSGGEKPDQAILSAIWVAASEVVRLYDEWSRMERRPLGE
jgi:hypothetical protein